MVLTNVYGAALTIRAAYDALVDSGGHLLLTSSVAGRRVLPGSFYSITKHAVTAMGEAARQELGEKGVRVTLIEPGVVDTPFFDNKPKIRALDDDDIARAVMFAVEQPAHDAAPLVGRDRLADREERPAAAVALERLRDRLRPGSRPVVEGERHDLSGDPAPSLDELHARIPHDGSGARVTSRRWAR